MVRRPSSISYEVLDLPSDLDTEGRWTHQLPLGCCAAALETHLVSLRTSMKIFCGHIQFMLPLHLFPLSFHLFPALFQSLPSAITQTRSTQRERVDKSREEKSRAEQNRTEQGRGEDRRRGKRRGGEQSRAE